jgi:hypothetical protein
MLFGWEVVRESGAVWTLQGWEEKIPVRIDQIGIYIILAVREEGLGGGRGPVAGSCGLVQKATWCVTGGRFWEGLRKN